MLRLKFLRMSRGLRQEQIADLLDIPRPHVSQIENGVRNPRPRDLAALGRIFNCDPARLFEHVTEEAVS